MIHRNETNPHFLESTLKPKIFPLNHGSYTKFFVWRNSTIETLSRDYFQPAETFNEDFCSKFRFAFFLSILPRCLKFRVPSPSLCLNFSPLKFLCPILSLFLFLSLSVCPRRFQLCVHRLVRKSNGLWARSAARAETVCIHRVGSVNASAGRRVSSVTGELFRLFSHRVSVFRAIRRSYCEAGAHARTRRTRPRTNFVARPRVYNAAIMNALNVCSPRRGTVF